MSVGGSIFGRRVTARERIDDDDVDLRESEAVGVGSMRVREPGGSDVLGDATPCNAADDANGV